MQQPLVGAGGKITAALGRCARGANIGDDLASHRIGLPTRAPAAQLARLERSGRGLANFGRGRALAGAHCDDRHANRVGEGRHIEGATLGIEDVALRDHHEKTKWARRELAREPQPQGELRGVDDLHDEQAPLFLERALENPARDPFVGVGVDNRVQRVKPGHIRHRDDDATRQRHVGLEDIDGDAGEISNVRTASRHRIVERRLARVGATHQCDQRLAMRLACLELPGAAVTARLAHVARLARFTLLAGEFFIVDRRGRPGVHARVSDSAGTT